MARSRKMPPLFEVMRETDRRAEASRESHPPGVILPKPTEVAAPRVPDERTQTSRLRLSHAAGANGSRSDDEGPDAAPGKGVVLPLPLVLTALGILVGVIAIIAIIAFNAGAKRERDQLLPSDTGGPPAVTPSRTPGDSGVTDDSRTTPPPSRDTGAKPPASTGPALPVFGDDPRVGGSNYLIVERLTFDDAMAAAQFLTDNGVPSVVVAPEGTPVSELQRQPRGIWLVVVREGFTREEFRSKAARVSEVKNAVIKIGRRWKQDKKGTTDFASCLWDKFGK